MFAVGHLALGYLTAKISSKALKVNINIPLILLLSLLPDIDLIIPRIEHRGPLHSVFVYTLVFIPAFIMYKKRALPYFVALAQHSLLGDLPTGGGVQILWPLTSNWYGAGIIMTSLMNVLIEWSVFMISLTLMWKTKDLLTLFQHHPSNLLLTVPVFTIILPAFISYPLAVPAALLIPHIVYLAFFVISILTDLKTIFQRKP